MLNRFRRSIRKYPLLSINLTLIIVGFVLIYTNMSSIGNAVLTVAALIGLVDGFNKALDILRHGYYGIQLLPITALIFALFLRQPQVAAVLALAIMIEQPFIGKSKRSLFQAKHAPLVKSLDIASLPFTVLVFLIGGAIWTVTRDSGRFLEVIAVASTAPLLLAAPLLIKYKMAVISRDSIKIASARIFELLSDARTIIFKKSGVLTDEKLELSKVHVFGKADKGHVLQIAAALASESSHPIAGALVEFVRLEQKVDRAKHANNVPGQGIAGRKKGTELLIGRYSFLASKDVEMPKQALVDTGAIIYVAEGGNCIGAISFTEKPQANLKSLSANLKKLGFNTIEIVSGTSSPSTAAIARAAKVASNQGDMTTSEIIERVQSHSAAPLIFVGSDEQDEAVLPQAGISVSANPDVVHASVEISDYSLAKLLALLTASKKAIRSARWLALTTTAITLVFIIMAATGRLTTFYAALVHLGITLLVLLLATDLRAVRPR